MKLKQLLTDDDAVSPVIGVILMVAITVILAAVIGTFVLGLGDRVGDAQPTATFTFEYGNSESVTITHDGGDAVEDSQLNVSIGGTNVYGNEAPIGSNTQPGTADNWDGKVSAGDSLKIVSSSVTNGATVRVIWRASGSDKTVVIGESEVST